MVIGVIIVFVLWVWWGNIVCLYQCLHEIFLLDLLCTFYWTNVAFDSKKVAAWHSSLQLSCLQGIPVKQPQKAAQEYQKVVASTCHQTYSKADTPCNPALMSWVPGRPWFCLQWTYLAWMLRSTWAMSWDILCKR